MTEELVQPPTGAYAVLLRAYPPSWHRDGRTAEILGVLLDTADAQKRTRPTARESVDLIVNGVRARLRSVEAFLPYTLRERTGQVHLVAGTALALFLLIFGELRTPILADGQMPREIRLYEFGWGPFQTPAALTYFGWLACAVSYVAGRPQWTRKLALITLSYTAVLPTLVQVTYHGQPDTLPPGLRPPGGVLCALVVLNVGLLLLPPRRPRLADRMRLAASVLLLLEALTAWRLITRPYNSEYTYGPAQTSSRWAFYWIARDPDGTIGQALVKPTEIAVIVALGLALLAGRRGLPWLPALASLSVPVALLGQSRYSTSQPTQFLRDVTPWAIAVGVIYLACGFGGRLARNTSQQ